MDKKYERIIHMPHPVSPTRARMSVSRRAAQFAPFAALTGYDAVIGEAARQTEPEIFLDESEKGRIGACLAELQARIGGRPAVFVRYFIPDGKKSGGSYRDIHGKVIKIDKNRQKMVLESGEIILFKNIFKLNME